MIFVENDMTKHHPKGIGIHGQYILETRTYKPEQQKSNSMNLCKLFAF